MHIHCVYHGIVKIIADKSYKMISLMWCECMVLPIHYIYIQPDAT